MFTLESLLPIHHYPLAGSPPKRTALSFAIHDHLGGDCLPAPAGGSCSCRTSALPVPAPWNPVELSKVLTLIPVWGLVVQGDYSEFRLYGCVL